MPTLSQRLKYLFPFFGDEWLKTGGIGEFTSGGVEGLRAIAKAGWRAEDHALNLAMVTNEIKDRETVNAEIPLSGLRWIISHVPEFPMDLANRMNAMGMERFSFYRQPRSRQFRQNRDRRVGCCATMIMSP